MTLSARVFVVGCEIKFGDVWNTKYELVDSIRPYSFTTIKLTARRRTTIACPTNKTAKNLSLYSGE